MTPPISIVVCLLTCFTYSSASYAQLIVYESFDYKEGDTLLNQNGGIGFSGAWKAGGFNASLNSNYVLSRESLDFRGVKSSGQRAFTSSTPRIAGITRELKSPLGEVGTTRWLSFMIRPEGKLNEGVFNGFMGLVLENENGPELFIGKPGNEITKHYAMEIRGGRFQQSTFIATTIDRVALLVLKCELTDEFDTFTLYASPNASPKPGTDPEKSFHVLRYRIDEIPAITIYSSGSFSIDEIRIGNTFSDVTPEKPLAQDSE